MNAAEIKRFFDDYRATLTEVERLDILVRTQHDWDAWQRALTERADYLHNEYSRMREDIRQALDVFRADTPDVDEAAWTQFRMSLRDCYTADAHDLAVINVAAQILLNHVEKHDPDNLEARVQAYLYLGYTNLEYSRIVRDGFSEKSIEYYQKIADLWPRYGEISSSIVHQAIVVSLINLEMTCVCLGTYPPEKGYVCWQAMKQIQASPAFKRLRETETSIANTLDLYVDRYETDAFAVAMTPKKPFDPALKAELMAMTERAYAEKVDPTNWTADMYQLLTSQIDFAIESGQMTVYECWETLHHFYMQTRVAMNEKEIDVISYYTTCLHSLLLLLDEADMPREEKRLHFQEYQHEIQSFITDYNKRSCDAYTLNSALEDLAFLPESYKLFDTPEEKIDFMFRMVIVRHCTTFLHSQMVSAFSQAILTAILSDAPELLVGYHDLQTPDEVRMHRAELLQFIDDAALLHDVGKNAMLTIIETQHRPLSDDEFAIIRNHPSKGAEYLSIDPDLARFKDITNGHHKFYNGKGGYPADFDNTASPERIMIDLITLCDCLDAATDCYGRNYHQAKSVYQVLDEFQRDSGVRYNPDLVRFLCDSPELVQTLQTISGKKRLEIYYQTYQKYFM